MVRVFLLWEAFQPEPKRVENSALKNLTRLCDAAHDDGLKVILTLFVGHLSGINLLPLWLLEGKKVEQRFPIYCSGRLCEANILDFFRERELRKAQKLLLREVAGALEHHPAVFAFDLGNEPSNLLVPMEDYLRLWLEDMAEEAKRYDDVPVTVGLHQEDLLRREGFNPGIVKDYTDFLSIHAYPFYLPFMDVQLDETFPLFICELTGWLSGSEKKVVLEELGAPSEPPMDTERGVVSLFHEEEIERYLSGALRLVFSSGIDVALLWCFSDYDRPLWDTPPFDRNVHERFFGLRRFDGKEKSYANLKKQLKIGPRRRVAQEWIDVERDEYFRDPASHMKRLFERFKGLQD